MSDSETLRLLHGQLEDDYRFIVHLRRGTQTCDCEPNVQPIRRWPPWALAYLIHHLYTAFESYFLRVAKHFGSNLDDSAWHR